jgi:hypothetical protein
MDPDQAPDPTPFFGDFKDAKFILLNIFFLITYPQAHYLQSKNMLILRILIRIPNTVKMYSIFGKIRDVPRYQKIAGNVISA